MSGSTAFFGASTGVGLSALKHILPTSSLCQALCRNPDKLTSRFDAPLPSNLKVIKGDVYDKETVKQCLQTPNGALVDQIIFTVGMVFTLTNPSSMDAHVCENGISVILEAIAELQKQGASGSPHIVVFSSTGVSKFGRDMPLLVAPLYLALKSPHKDKVAMEGKVTGSGLRYTIVRGSLLTNGKSDRNIRVGIEHHKDGVESLAIGYTISREDAGQWIANNLVLNRNPKYVNKTATITY